MAWGLPAEISSMNFCDDVVPLNGNWCVRLRRGRRGFGGLREGGRSEVRPLQRLRLDFEGRGADLKVGQYMGTEIAGQVWSGGRR
jgi:hypothetical protein